MASELDNILERMKKLIDDFKAKIDVLQAHVKNRDLAISRYRLEEKEIAALAHWIDPESETVCDVMREMHKKIKVIEQPEYLIWSNEHNAYWRPNSAGYAKKVGEAGYYSFAEADSICIQAGIMKNGQPAECIVHKSFLVRGAT